MKQPRGVTCSVGPKQKARRGKKTAIRVERDQYVVPSPILGKRLPLYLYLVHFILLFELT